MNDMGANGMRVRMIFVMMGCFLSCIHSHAQSPRIIERCIADAGTVVNQWKPCARLAVGAEYRRLTATIQAITATATPDAAKKIEEDARSWNQLRTMECIGHRVNADLGCLQEMMTLEAVQLSKKAGLSLNYDPDEIPHQLWGTWVVANIVPTNTISCWDEQQARSLLGTKITYAAHSYRWKDQSFSGLNAALSAYDANGFRETYSAPTASGSQVDFRELGIETPLVYIATLTGFSDSDAYEDGAPAGREVVLKNSSTIEFEVCNVYFEAKRAER